MSGWRATGNTAREWRHCPHLVVNGRCVDCRAIHVPEFVQAHQPGTGLGAIPIGSPYLVTPKLDDYSLMTAGPARVTPKEWVGKVR